MKRGKLDLKPLCISTTATTSSTSTIKTGSAEQSKPTTVNRVVPPGIPTPGAKYFSMYPEAECLGPVKNGENEGRYYWCEKEIDPMYPDRFPVLFKIKKGSWRWADGKPSLKKPELRNSGDGGASTPIVVRDDTRLDELISRVNEMIHTFEAFKAEIKKEFQEIRAYMKDEDDSYKEDVAQPEYEDVMIDDVDEDFQDAQGEDKEAIAAVLAQIGDDDKKEKKNNFSLSKKQK